MENRLTSKWGDKVKIPVSPMVIKDIEDRDEYFKVQKEVEDIVIRLAEYEDLGSVKELENRIQLKNIDLTGYSEHEQVSKYLEESNELIKVILDKDFDSTFEHFCEEVFDQLQVCIGIAEKKYGKSADDVMAEYSKHLLKMKQRGNKPRKKVQEDGSR